jgi:uncharacterized damage-inducible protein DinB
MAQAADTAAAQGYNEEIKMSTNTETPAEQSVLQTFFRDNLWANLRLCDSCLTLTDDQLNHSDAGTYGSIWATLTHLVRAEEYYLFWLTGQEIAVPEPGSQTRIIELKKRARQSGTMLMEVAVNIQPDIQMQVGEGDESEQIPAEILLLQAIHHAHEHRTQITTLLGQQGIAPPALSGWSYFNKEMSSL